MGQRVTIVACVSDRSLICGSETTLGAGYCNNPGEMEEEKMVKARQFHLNVLDKAFTLDPSDDHAGVHLKAIPEETSSLNVTSEEQCVEEASADFAAMLQSPNMQIRKEGMESIIRQQLLGDEDGLCREDEALATLYGAISRNDLDAIKDFYASRSVEQGSTPLVFSNGLTPLHLAVSSGNAPVLEWLLKHKVAPIDAVDVCNRNALHYAFIAQRNDIIALILNHNTAELASIAGSDAVAAVANPSTSSGQNEGDARVTKGENDKPYILTSRLPLSALLATKDHYGNTPLDLDSSSVRDRSDSEVTTTSAALSQGRLLPLCSPLSDAYSYSYKGSPQEAQGLGPLGLHGFAATKRDRDCDRDFVDALGLGLSLRRSSSAGITFESASASLVVVDSSSGKQPVFGLAVGSGRSNRSSSPKIGKMHFTRRVRKTASLVAASLLPPSVYMQKSKRPALGQVQAQVSVQTQIKVQAEPVPLSEPANVDSQEDPLNAIPIPKPLPSCGNASCPCGIECSCGTNCSCGDSGDLGHSSHTAREPGITASASASASDSDSVPYSVSTSVSASASYLGSASASGCDVLTDSAFGVDARSNSVSSVRATPGNSDDSPATPSPEPISSSVSIPFPAIAPETGVANGTGIGTAPQASASFLFGISISPNCSGATDHTDSDETEEGQTVPANADLKSAGFLSVSRPLQSCSSCLAFAADHDLVATVAATAASTSTFVAGSVNGHDGGIEAKVEAVVGLAQQ